MGLPHHPMKSRIRMAVCCLGIALMAAGCSEAKLAATGVKELGKSPDASSGHYKVGKPYQIRGKWYHPEENYSYNAVGEASWYGPKFHGRKTANGEIFDQWAMTAAHPTLPMPSQVQVTNLENGRSVTLRINDRGPFANNRIIDVSRAAARALGFEGQGVARVRVTINAQESLALKAQATGRPVSATQQAGTQANPPPTNPTPRQTQPVPQTASSAPSHGGTSASAAFIQVGAFVDQTNAVALRDRLAAQGAAHIQPVNMGTRTLHRVRLGPFADAGQATGALQTVQSAGFPQARIVIE